MSQRRDEILLRSIGTAVKYLREAKNVSQEDVYNDTGIHVGRIESLNGNPSISTLSDLCCYFEIKLSDFFNLVEKDLKDD
jgi:transcriptional regulator with XRE-family HTH domain